MIQSHCFLFGLDYLSIDVNGVLKSPTIFVLLSISSFMFIINCFIYLGAPMVGCINSCYIFLLDCSLSNDIVPFFLSCYHLFLKSSFSDISIATLDFFLISIINFCMINVSPSPFNLQMFLALKQVSYRQHIEESGFSIFCHPASSEWSI